MTQKVDSGQREGYAGELAGVWRELARTLRRLDAIAARPEVELAADDAPAELAALRYALHRSGERAYGLVPPPGAEVPHGELLTAIEDARDATAEVGEAVELDGPDGVLALVHEWRGSLFRVRLAQLRLAARRTPPPPAAVPEPRGRAAPLAAFTLTVLGAAAFVSGAVVASWPLWALGVLAVVAGLLVYRP